MAFPPIDDSGQSARPRVAEISAIADNRGISKERRMAKMRKQSYQIDNFRAPQLEEKRLTHRARARLDRLVPDLVEVGLRPSMKVLDIGSGSGIRSLEIARYVKQGSVLGVDTSKTLLSAANQLKTKKKAKNLEFINADLFSAEIPQASFDFAYMRLVLQHLPDPVAALKAIKGYLKPSGILFIEETDRDWMMIYPTPKRWNQMYERAKEIQTEKGGDPRSGRKLGHYLVQAGFKNVQGSLVPVHGSGSVLDDWLENYAPTFFNNLSEREAQQGLAALSEIKKLNEKSPVYFHQIWFQGVGVKPGAPRKN